MPPHIPESALVTLLRKCYLTPKCQSLPHSQARYFRTSAGRRSQRIDQDNRRISSPIALSESHGDENNFVKLEAFSASINNGRPKPHTPRQNIAVLGGGITGLASAFYLSKELPNANITIYEGSDRLGGWLRSRHVDVGNGNIVFEQGPRTLRPAPPAGLVTLNLINLLGLENELIITTKDSVAAQNRFLYYPNHLVRMPAPGSDFFDMLWSFLSEPVFKGVFMSLIREWDMKKRPESLEDESIGSFMSRRFGSSAIPDNIVSAVLHGIYAGDIYQLSIKSLQPSIWHAEAHDGGILKGMLATARSGGSKLQYRDGALMQELRDEPKQQALTSLMSTASVYTFRRGISQLSDTMVMKLKENPKIDIKTSSRISSLEYDGQDDKVKIFTSPNQPPKAYDQVISTISGRTLSTLVTSSNPLPSLAATHAVTVMVVNLYFRHPALLPENGFGYLIPRSVAHEQNPEMALGVVFDSDASIGQDSVPGTKLTVMLGGHWWDNFTSYPDEEEGAAMAKAVLKRHLKIDIEPDYVHVGLQRECIPQYTVGHDARMKRAHGELMSAFKGKLAVAGNSYTGVGLNDCVRSARDLVLDVAGYEGSGGVTGLEQFLTERRWVKAIVARDIEEKP